MSNAQPPVNGGRRANQSGNLLEAMVQTALSERGYQEVPRADFLSHLSERRYARQWVMGRGIYETLIAVDFAIIGVETYPRGLIVECKWQQVSGSVDEKLPYLALNIEQRFPFPTIVVVDGAGWKPGSIQWLRRRVPVLENLVGVFDMRELLTWSNQML